VLRVDLFEHLQRLPSHMRSNAGGTINHCTADVETVDTLFSEVSQRS
jgi:ABC-type multidrug transport system fused ATPase/permease subunit